MLKEVAEKRPAGDQGIYGAWQWIQDRHEGSGDPWSGKPSGQSSSTGTWKRSVMICIVRC